MRQISEANIREWYELCEAYINVKTDDRKLDEAYQICSELPNYMTYELPERSEDNTYEKMREITKWIEAITWVELEILLDNR